MVPLTMLWLPILVSAVFVFVASNIVWMALPFWRRGDYGKLPDEQAALAALSSAKSGQYVVPCIDWSKETAEEREERRRGPNAFVLLRNPGGFSFAKLLTQWFLYSVVIAIFVAYITGRTRAAGSPYLEVFRVAGASTFLAYGFRSVSDGIWYGKPWKVVIKDMVDGLVYSLLTAGTFGWLWPR